MNPEEIFTKLERIGRGSFGEVYKGINNHTAEVKIGRKKRKFRVFQSLGRGHQSAGLGGGGGRAGGHPTGDQSGVLSFSDLNFARK